MSATYRDDPHYMAEEAVEYMNQWVAFSPDHKEVIGHGTALEASEMAKKSKYGFGILFFMSPELYNPLAYLGSNS